MYLINPVKYFCIVQIFTSTHFPVLRKMKGKQFVLNKSLLLIVDNLVSKIQICNCSSCSAQIQCINQSLEFFQYFATRQTYSEILRKFLEMLYILAGAQIGQSPKNWKACRIIHMHSTLLVYFYHRLVHLLTSSHLTCLVQTLSYYLSILCIIVDSLYMCFLVYSYGPCMENLQCSFQGRCEGCSFLTFTCWEQNDDNTYDNDNPEGYPIQLERG